tara:strand:+ start:6916 stop:7143 length:228 start_codon:yes stop_codon:yes gene_type:complete
MRTCLLFFSFLAGCSKKFVNQPKQATQTVAREAEENIIYKVDELQKYDINGPLIWFAIIVGMIMLLTFSSVFFKK